MLQDVTDIVSRTGALLGDPTNLVFTETYLLPFIDQEYDEMDVELEQMGMQYTEAIAVFNIDANITDLSPFLATGQPLASMKLPKRIRWKQVSFPDLFYSESERVDELDEVDVTSIGAFEYRFADGAIQITPSAIPLTLKVYFDAVSTNIVDSTGQIIRGTAHILALRVAIYIATIRKNPMLVMLQKKHTRSWKSFKGVLSGQNQSKLKVNPALHPRRATRSVFLPASSSGT